MQNGGQMRAWRHHHWPPMTTWPSLTSQPSWTTWPLLTSTKSLNQNNIWLLMASWTSLSVTVSSAPSFDIATTFDHLTPVDLQHKWPLDHHFTWSVSLQPKKLIQHSLVPLRLWIHPKSSLIQMLQMGCRAPPESHYRPHLLPERSTIGLWHQLVTLHTIWYVLGAVWWKFVKKPQKQPCCDFSFWH